MGTEQPALPEVVNLSSIAVNGPALRSLRRRGRLTQLQLGVRAGVSERTVRSAENGSPVRLSSLELMADVLEASLEELIADHVDLQSPERPNALLGRVLTALEAYANYDITGFKDLFTDETRVEVVGPPSVPFAGNYRGLDGLRRLRDCVESEMRFLDTPEISHIRASDDLLVLGGVDYIQATKSKRVAHMWWRHVWEFKDQRVVRVEDTFDTLLSHQLFHEPA